MSEPRIPIIRGALVSGPAAYALARVLDREEIAERLAERGYDQYRELALAALEAIDREAADWGRAAREYLERQRNASANGTTPVPQERWLPSSPVMTVDEAAEHLNVTPRYVRQLAARGRLAGRRHGRAWLLDRAAVAALARERSNDLRPTRRSHGDREPAATVATRRPAPAHPEQEDA